MSRHRLPLLLQAEAMECGLACLAMVAASHGHMVDMPALRHRFAVSTKGANLKSLLDIAARLDLEGRGVRLEPDEIAGLQLPAVLHWDTNHFVVLKSVQRGWGGGSKVVIHDPARGILRLTMEELANHFTGVAVELRPGAGFQKRDTRKRLSVRALCGDLTPLWPAAIQALFLSLILQVFVIASPFYMQLAVDEAIVQGDQGLLTALALGFGLFTAIKLGADLLRGRLLAAISGAVNFQVVATLFHHLLRLPLDWFEKRGIGDMTSRFGATRPITELISQGLVAALVDGVMALVTLALIVAYSPALAAIVLGALALLVALRLGSLGSLRRRQEEAIRDAAAEQSCFIETLRAMQAIKLAGAETEREARWQVRCVRLANRQLALLRQGLSLRIGHDAINGLEKILVVYAGARLIISDDLSLGMLFAFVAYKQQFLDTAGKLLETLIAWSMLDLHLDRIADIALAPPEAGLDNHGLIVPVLEGGLELCGVSFRYGEGETAVLDGLNFKVAPGELVAITGTSGGGKTTLMKIMLGLLKPSAGEVRVDGRPLDQLGLAAFRAQIGVVMQDDQLLTGSIAENISFFSPVLDVALMRQCAATAGIEAEILAMPMNYNTMIGEVGSGLSGGQRQRLLLARALYRRPVILFLDEGTSNLDLAKEREVAASLARLRITRIMIAHRPETIAAADRVVVFEAGRITRDSAAATRHLPSAKSRAPAGL
ncbi:peptidase domain-containing ABC transporter [Rhizobium laguerreae]|uniref:peptidase domain-containing ABC transporter n=1 Tax=Rhizobium laguerreae TaxID=1076926 RepID=UPI001C9088B2|nr:peptidase domain-containing ABC transporter [Rhizobium laguerreae]MBY3384010.1 peptidase domain-containing ABC transporter [Rhizobium laguerreae]